MNNARMVISVKISGQVPAFNSFGYAPRNGIDASMFNFLKNMIRVYMCTRTIHTRTLANLMGVKWKPAVEKHGVYVF